MARVIFCVPLHAADAVTGFLWLAKTNPSGALYSSYSAAASAAAKSFANLVITSESFFWLSASISFLSRIEARIFRMLGLEVSMQVVLECLEAGHGQLVDEALGACEDGDHLLLDWERHVLSLLQQLGQALTAIELGAGRRV